MKQQEITTDQSYNIVKSNDLIQRSRFDLNVTEQKNYTEVNSTNMPRRHNIKNIHYQYTRFLRYVRNRPQ